MSEQTTREGIGTWKARNIIGNIDALEGDMGGDNIAIALAMYFDDHPARPSDDPIDTDLGWGEWVMEKTHSALDRIAAAIITVQSANKPLASIVETTKGE
jgi:hypothetical protein